MTAPRSENEASIRQITSRAMPSVNVSHPFSDRLEVLRRIRLTGLYDGLAGRRAAC